MEDFATFWMKTTQLAQLVMVNILGYNLYIFVTTYNLNFYSISQIFFSQ